MNQAQRERLQYIHNSLKLGGCVSVRVLKIYFKISGPTATKDVNLYKELAPNNMEFSEKKKLYLRLDSFVDIEIPEASETKALAAVQVLESDREIVIRSEKYKHYEVYSAGVVALGLKGE